MGIKYPVGAGTVLLCNYDTGFRPPEMVKRRPVVVVSPRLPHRDGLCAVVPLSTSAPFKATSYSCELEFIEPLPHPFVATTVWAKCDMIATVCFDRLDLFQTKRDQEGKRKYLHPKLNSDQMKIIHSGILHSLGLGALTKHL